MFSAAMQFTKAPTATALNPLLFVSLFILCTRNLSYKNCF